MEVFFINLLPHVVDQSTPVPLQIDRPGSNTLIQPPPKGVFRKSSFNPHRRTTQNYNIVEDLAQAPSAMSSLEVL
jgi:hypothetical protein